MEIDKVFINFIAKSDKKCAFTYKKCMKKPSGKGFFIPFIRRNNAGNKGI